MARNRISATALRFTIFHGVIRWGGPLRRSLVLVQLFDSFLWVVTAITAWGMVVEMRQVSAQLARWPGVTTGRHRLGGRQFNYQGRELGHVHSNGVVDLRFSSAEHDDALQRDLAWPHHVVPNSNWVTFFIERRGQAAEVVALFAVPFSRLQYGGSDDSTEEGG